MDIKLYFKEKGRGEPFILLHGNGENWAYFKHQIDYFSNKYHVIAIDTRGHGLSPRGSAPFTIRQFAADLFNFTAEQEIESANILGFSDGGNIAIAFAMQYPQKVNKLILNGANLNTQGVKATVQKWIDNAYNDALEKGKNDEQAMRKAEILGLMVNEPNFTTSDLKLIKAKTLVIVGTNDMIKRQHSRSIHKHIANSELQIVEGDHFLANKNWKEFNTVVNDFLNRE